MTEISDEVMQEVKRLQEEELNRENEKKKELIKQQALIIFKMNFIFWII